MDRSKLRKQSNDKEDDIEQEQKDPVAPTQVKATQWNRDEGHDQRQTQRPGENPRQQTLLFKLRIKEEMGCVTAVYTVSQRNNTFIVCDWEDYLHIIMRFNHLHQAAQTHAKQHIWRTYSQGLFLKKPFLQTLLCSETKDTENDASKAGRYGHSWVTLSGYGDVRKTVWKRNTC